MSHLTVNNQQGLVQYEAVIEKGLETFYDVGNALLAIKDEGLYEQYGTFEDYCEQRWDIKRSRIYRLIGAAEVIQNLSTIVDTDLSTQVDILPANEAQVRPLTSVPDEDQAAVWQEAVETAPNGHVTSEHVQPVIDQHMKKPNYKRDAKASRAVDEYV